MMRAFLALVLAAVQGPLLPAARAQGTPGNSRAPHTADQLIQLFRAAHQKRAIAEIARLVYWGGTSHASRADMERLIADDFPLVIAGVTIQPLAAGEVLQYTKDGVTYRPTLRPIGRMKVDFVPGTPPSGGVTTTSYLVGAKDGVYYLLSAEPAPR